MELVDTGLTINPHLQVKPERDGGSITAIAVRAPVRGQSMRVTKITRAADPKIFSALLIHSAAGSLATANFTGAERARLVELGVLLSPEQVAGRIWFSCDLTDPPVDLVPERARRAVRRPDRVTDLMTNPTLRHLGTEGPTAAMRGRVSLPNAFRPQRSWLSIDDPVTGTPCLYSYPEDIAEQVNALRPGQHVSESVGPEIRECLFTVGVIESAAEAARERDECARARAAACSALDQRRYVILPKMLPPLQLAAIRQYYRSVIAEGFMPFGDEEWPARFFSGRDPIGYFYQQQLTGLVSDIAGQRVKPSFSFFASYHPGSTLPAHRDREQCEWALSLLLDQSPEADTSSWPLYLQPPGANQATPIFTGVGDGTLYYRREVRHHRDALTTEDYCSFWFLFYVAESFDGSLD